MLLMIHFSTYGPRQDVFYPVGIQKIAEPFLERDATIESLAREKNGAKFVSPFV